MPDRSRLALLLLAPLALVAGAVAAALLLSGPASAANRVIRIALPRASGDLDLPRVGGERGSPLVVIDAGHGGHDPGAAGVGVVEKDLVLALAQALRAELLRGGGVRVALTRDDDRYLVHAERFEIARRLDGDLFLSIHADSAGEAREVAGASIYTLSAQASSEAAARFAARENASDRLNGVDIGGQSDVVSTILVELSQRRTQARSEALARRIYTAGQGTLAFHPQPLRSAALKVLRAPDVPSLLFESGYITNAEEAARLTSEAGRRRFAQVMAGAIRAWLAEREGA